MSTSKEPEEEWKNLPWQFRFEKLYKKLHGLLDNDPLLSGHCQTFIKAFESILIQETKEAKSQGAREALEGLVKDVEKMNENDTIECDGWDECDTKRGHKQAIDYFLSILQSNLKKVENK